MGKKQFDAQSSSKRPGDDQRQQETVNKMLRVLSGDNSNLQRPNLENVVDGAMIRKTLSKISRDVRDVDDVSVDEVEMVNRRFMDGRSPRCNLDQDSSSDESDSDDEEQPTQQTLSGKITELQQKVTSKVKVSTKAFASKYVRSFVKKLIPVQQISTLASFVFFSFVLNAGFLMVFLPLASFASSFIALLLATVKLIKGGKRFREFQAWSNMLAGVKTSKEREKAENKYILRHISPLLTMLLAVPLIIMSLSISADYFIPFPELAIISLISLIASLRSARSVPSTVALVLQVVATFIEVFNPYNISRISSTLSPPYVLITINLASFLRLLALFILFYVPFRTNYRSWVVGCYHAFIPQAFIMIWWEFFVLFIQHCTLQGLARASLEVLALIFSMHLAIAIFVIVFLKWLVTLHFVQIFITISLLSIPLAYVRLSYKWREVYAKIPFSSIPPAQKILAVVLASVLVILGVLLYQPSGLVVSKSTLTFPEYHQTCLTPHVDNNALKQRSCHHLSDHHVSWIGLVVDVNIHSIENKFESALNVFPAVVANWLSCVYGHRYESDGAARITQRACHLEHYNIYTFHVMANMHIADDTHASIKLIAGHAMKDVMFVLKPAMKISFEGVLDPDKNQITLHKLKVIAGVINGTVTEMPAHQVAGLVSEAISSFFKFALSPTFTTAL